MKEKIIKSEWIAHAGFASWLVNHMKPKIVVDLGTNTGCSAIAFAGPNIGTIHTVDKFDNKQVYMEALDNVSYVKNVVVHKSKFSDLAENWKKSIDILHIDGDHEFESTNEDCRLWIPKVDKNGIVLIHDVWNPRFPDVLAVFYSNVGGYKLMFPRGLGLGLATSNVKLYTDIYKKWHDHVIVNSVIECLLNYSARMHGWLNQVLEWSALEKDQLE